MAELPVLDPAKLAPTRDYLREAALVLGALQREFLPEQPRDWQHGLEVTMRGLVTQPFMLEGEEHRGTLDLVRRKVRLDDQWWLLEDCAGPELLEHIKLWLANKKVKVDLDEPDFAEGPRRFDPEQSDTYAKTLWWLDKQFRTVKAGLTGGATSPIFIYPHHFDLSLTWFPWDDERQVGLGWSTGDETIHQPYIYLTAYPEPKGFAGLELPAPAYLQKEGFSGAILLSNDLAKSHDPEKLFQDFAGLISRIKPLFG